MHHAVVTPCHVGIWFTIPGTCDETLMLVGIHHIMFLQYENAHRPFHLLCVDRCAGEIICTCYSTIRQGWRVHSELAVLSSKSGSP